MRASPPSGHAPLPAASATASAPAWRSEQPVSLEGLLEAAASRSYVASLEDQPRAELLDRIRTEFAGEPEPIVLRYEVDVFVADRAP